MSAPRKLDFPLNYAVSLVALVDEGDQVFDLPVFPADSDERIFVTMHISLNEFVKLATAVDVGSDIAYGEDAVAIWWLWTRAIMSESICEAIQNCIASNQGTRDVISSLFLDNTSEQYYEQLLAKLQEDLILPVTPVNPATDCNDNLWGAIVQFVDIITKDVTDFLELVEANPIDQTVEVINVLANLPVVDELGIDALTEFFVWAVDQLGVYWLASLTDEYKEGLACQVFCRVKDTCQVSVDDVWQVINERVNPSFNIDNLITVVTNLSQFVFTGASDFVCDVWLFAMFRFASLGDLLFKATGIQGLAYANTRLRKQLMIGLNNPDSDWQILCDCAVPVKENIPAFGRGYSINGGEFIIVNPVTDGQYVIPSVPIGSEVTLITNGSATAIGDCASGYGITVTVTYVDGYSTRRVYGAGTCAEVGFDYNVGDTFTNVQINGFSFGSTTFRIDA